MNKTKQKQLENDGEKQNGVIKGKKKGKEKGRKREEGRGEGEGWSKDNLYLMNE